jgi:hypothetical protein
MGSTTLNPTVSRVGYWHWLFHLLIYAVSLAIGASVAFMVIMVLASGADGVLGSNGWYAVAIPIVALAIGRDLGFRTPVPYRNVQVPQVLRYLMPPSFLAVAYGTQLGTGFLTRYTYSSHTAAMLFLPFVARDNARLIPVAIGVFALGKTIVVIAGAGTSSDEGPLGIDQRLRWRRRGLLLTRQAIG